MSAANRRPASDVTADVIAGAAVHAALGRVLIVCELSTVQFGIMSIVALSSDDQRTKRSPGSDAQDLEDSVGGLGRDFKRVLLSVFRWRAAGVVVA